MPDNTHSRPLFSSKARFPAIGAIVVVCLLVCMSGAPASAGDAARAVPLVSDDRGNRAWVEIESAGGRTKATPFIAVGEKSALERAEKLEAGKKLEGGEKAAIPLPAIKRFVED